MGKLDAGVNISDANAVVGEVKTDSTFYAVSGGKKTGSGTKTLSAASETVDAGYYAATTLSAVDADLATGNIKSGTTVFGFAGTVDPIGTETFERYYTADLGTGATYTPGAEGIFSATSEDQPGFLRVKVNGSLGFMYVYGNARSCDGVVGDGTNMQFSNNSGSASKIVIMRHHMSTGTYVRTYADLANAASYTPGESGFFTFGNEVQNVAFFVEYQYPGTWYEHITYDIDGGALGSPLVIGDGTNLRVTNNFGDQREWMLIRAELNT